MVGLSCFNILYKTDLFQHCASDLCQCSTSDLFQYGRSDLFQYVVHLVNLSDDQVQFDQIAVLAKFYTSKDIPSL